MTSEFYTENYLEKCRKTLKVEEYIIYMIGNFNIISISIVTPIKIPTVCTHERTHVWEFTS